jgi:hypothetical protein
MDIHKKRMSLMNEKTINLFKSWLKLNEDEKRDFVKEILSYNSLSPSEKAAVHKALDIK